MAFEKRLKPIVARLFTADGTSAGKITIADTRRFKVKTIVVLASSTQASAQFIVQRVESKNVMYVGPIGSKISDRSDISNFLVADSASVKADEQVRPTIPVQEEIRAVFSEEPTVAIRTMSVDIYGDEYTVDNPLPVAVSGGSGGTVTVSYPSNPTIVNISALLAATEYSYTFPISSRQFSIKDRAGDAKINISYIPGTTATIFEQIPYGVKHIVEEISTTAGFTIYFQVNRPGRIIEIVSWA